MTLNTQAAGLGNEPLIALVTVLYNCEKHLRLFFESLRAQADRRFLVVVIDNASADASLAQARALASAMEVPCDFIANDTNHGIATGNNQGIERALSLGIDHVVLINNDTGFDPELIAEIRRRAIGEAHSAWTCLAYHSDTDVRWYGGGRLSYWLARGIHYSQSESERITTSRAVTYAPTCLMYLHRSVFERIGLMDPRYFVYYDDTDFCRRMQHAGIALWYDPGVRFRHYVGGSSGGDLSAFFLRMSTLNKFVYIDKHYKYPQKLLILGLALASKLLQLASPRRRAATWAGLRSYLGRRGHAR